LGLEQPRRWLRHYQVGGTAAAALERLLGRCRSHRIAVVLVGVPVTRPHRDTYTAAIEAEFHAHLERLCQTYGCRFVDYRDQVPDSLFVDNHHLHLGGGMYFSQRLAREVLAPVWRAEIDHSADREGAGSTPTGSQ
jgi:hypothetical protein